MKDKDNPGNCKADKRARTETTLHIVARFVSVSNMCIALTIYHLIA